MNKNYDEGLAVLVSNLARIHSNVRYADAKSGVVLLINMSLLKVMYDILDKDASSILENITSNILIQMPIISLLISGFLCVLVIWPRGGEYSKERGVGLIDPVRIAQYKDAESYIKDVSVSEPCIIYQHAYELTWDISKTDRKKYRILRYALMISFVSWLISLIVIAILVIK